MLFDPERRDPGESPARSAPEKRAKKAAGDDTCQLVWEDEFDGDSSSVDLTKWAPEYTMQKPPKHAKYQSKPREFPEGQKPGDPQNSEWECYVDHSDSLRQEKGRLVIEAHPASNLTFPYCNFTSARIHSRKGFSTGYFKVRAKLPSGQGIWPAIWLEPQEYKYGIWPVSGEIDIAEMQGSRPNVSLGTLHYSTPAGPLYPHIFASHVCTLGDGAVDLSQDFHTYGLRWEREKVTWYIDDQECASTSLWMAPATAKNGYPAPFDQEFRLVLNLAVGGVFDLNPTPDTHFPSRMEVDFVRLYHCAGDDIHDGF